MVDGRSGSADAEPLAEVAALRQRRCGGVLVRSASKNGTPGQFITSTWSSLSIVPTASKNSAQFSLSLAVPIGTIYLHSRQVGAKF